MKPKITFLSLVYLLFHRNKIPTSSKTILLNYPRLNAFHYPHFIIYIYKIRFLFMSNCVCTRVVKTISFIKHNKHGFLIRIPRIIPIRNQYVYPHQTYFKPNTQRNQGKTAIPATNPILSRTSTIYVKVGRSIFNSNKFSENIISPLNTST